MSHQTFRTRNRYRYMHTFTLLVLKLKALLFCLLQEDMFITIISPKEDSSDSSGFLRGSLFDNTETSSLEIPELTFNAEEFLKVHNEALAIRRYGALFLDYLYTMEIEPERNSENDGESQVDGLEVVGEIRLVKELSFKKMIVGPIHLQLSSSVMHRMELVLKLSFEDIIPRKGQYIYVICWLGGLYKEKQSGVKIFTIQINPKMLNNLLFFPLSFHTHVARGLTYHGLRKENLHSTKNQSD